MPSLPDADLATRTSAPSRATAPEDILARVKSDGLRRRTRRHRRNALVAAFGLVILAVPAISLLPSGDSDDELDTAAEVEQPSTTDRPTTTERSTTTTADTTATSTVTTLAAPTITVVVPDPEASTESGASATTVPRRAPSTPRTTVPRRSPTTQLAPPTTATCRNSTEPSCGDFRWEPDPGSNAPLQANISASNSAPEAGETVTFTVTWSDADASLTFDRVAVDSEAGLSQACSTERRFGPWTPPARNGGSGELTFQREFFTAGEHFVTVALATADCNSPYGSERTVQMVVVVQEPPPDTTPTPGP